MAYIDYVIVQRSLRATSAFANSRHCESVSLLSPPATLDSEKRNIPTLVGQSPKINTRAAAEWNLGLILTRPQSERKRRRNTR